MITSIVISVLIAVYAALKLKVDLHKFQQNSYRNERYWKYLKNDIHSKIRMAEYASLGVGLLGLVFPGWFAYFLIPFLLITLYYVYYNKTYKPKVKFNFTSRAKRLYFTSFGLILAFSGLE
ncbi:MAG: hypothetical protein II165_03055, partial [Bacteroidales bacterium]|nr:hypothetical protein [Bacteroidales bacterium]